MKSTLLNMVLVLGGITLIAAACLGLVYDVTKGPIEQAKASKTTGALSQVMPEFDNDPSAGVQTIEIDGMPIKVYTGLKGDAVAGYAVETMTKNGFNGEIRLMVGFDPNGEIVNIEVLQHNETPGLGSKIADPDNVLLVSFQGKNPQELNMKVYKDGGDIDVITASTISSRAYVDAVERGYKAFQSVALGQNIAQEKPSDYLSMVLPNKQYVGVPETVEVNGEKAVVTLSSDEIGPLGYAVEVVTEDGFIGPIRLMVGFTPQLEIYNAVVMEQNETPGYGSQITDADNSVLASLKGKRGRDIDWRLKADGGDVDAISGSTVTSRAYMKAVKKAYDACWEYVRVNAWKNE